MTQASADRIDVAAALSLLAPKIGSASARVIDPRRLSGGATQEIWRFDLADGDCVRPLILRRAGDCDGSDTSVGLAIEARLMEAAAVSHVPVPPIAYVLSPEDGLGNGFVMAFVEGETLGGRIVRSSALAEARTTLARECGTILAHIHTVNAADFATLSRDTPAELVEQWRVRYRDSGRARPVFDLAFRWLSERCPPAPERACLVHGDFRNGNLMIGPEGVRAVLDWELAHVGDPMEDFGWLCVTPWRFGRIDKPVGGFGDIDDLVAGYEAESGARVDRAMLQWWETFGSLRWGVMCAGMTASYRTDDPSVERGMIARRSSENELDLLRLLAG